MISHWATGLTVITDSYFSESMLPSVGKHQRITDSRPYEEQFNEAVLAMESGDDNAKTKVAFFKLTGLGGAEIDKKGAVALLEERVSGSSVSDDEAMWMLALCCQYGIGTERNLSRAKVLYRDIRSLNWIGWFLGTNSKVDLEFDSPKRMVITSS